MEILNKRELQQTAFNHSSYVDFQDFMNLYKKCTEQPYSFLLILNLHHIIHRVSEKSFRKNIKTNHDS